MKLFGSLLVLCGVLLWGSYQLYDNHQMERGQPVEATESFIRKWLTNQNGTFATYIQEGDRVDEDLVVGREALAESLGIWMDYTIAIRDEKAFHQAYEQLETFFLDQDGFVYWKVTKDGRREVEANALVDDLRILHALYAASDRWQEPRYAQTAQRMGDFMVTHNERRGYVVDYFVRGNQSTSEWLTLSYIEPDALQRLMREKVMDPAMYDRLLDVLHNTPMDGPFFPKAFHIDTGTYQFDETINLIDQSLVAHYRAKINLSTAPFVQFIQEQLTTNGVIYGQYDRATRQPVVQYESPAIYGWLLLLAIELGETALGQQLYDRMIAFKSPTRKYYGGYSVYKGDTHIFDNLVPLLAEQTWLDAQK